jgi:hypothetical protein
MTKTTVSCLSIISLPGTEPSFISLLALSRRKGAPSCLKGAPYLGTIKPSALELADDHADMLLRQILRSVAGEGHHDALAHVVAMAGLSAGAEHESSGQEPALHCEPTNLVRHPETWCVCVVSQHLSQESVERRTHEAEARRVLDLLGPRDR